MSAKRKVRLGVFGGTFDPVHNNHLLLAREAARALALDKVLFVPTGQPSHRDSACMSPTSDRCAMVSLALAAERGYELSTVDAERPRPTYTVDTLRDLVEEYGSAKNLYFILGADNLSRLLQWHASAELLRLAHVVGCSRPGYRLIDPGLPPGTLTLLHIPRLEISATKIRRLIRAGRSVWHLTPEAVGRYIHNHGLYRSHGDARTSTSMKTTPRQDRAVDRDRLIVETSL